VVSGARRAIAVIAIAAAAANGCILFSSFDGLSGGVRADGGGAPEAGAPGDAGVAADGASCSTDTTYAWKDIPRFHGTQAVDADDADLCVLPATTFLIKNRHCHTHCAPEQAPDWADAAVTLRLGWSPAGLHLYARIGQPGANVAALGAPIDQGDAFEFLAAPVANGRADRAIHVVIAPPLGDIPARVTPSLAPETFAVKRVDGGYAVELAIAWTALSMPPPDAGRTLPLEMAFDVGAPDGGARYQSVLDFAGSIACARSCTPPYTTNDLAWPTPTLDP